MHSTADIPWAEIETLKKVLRHLKIEGVEVLEQRPERTSGFVFFAVKLCTEPPNQNPAPPIQLEDSAQRHLIYIRLEESKYDEYRQNSRPDFLATLFKLNVEKGYPVTRAADGKKVHSFINKTDATEEDSQTWAFDRNQEIWIKGVTNV